ncbi:YT521-B-like domain-containing protein [Biscogniauxia mediterranea]|nr:YT521-B-like domain-containing protein [Biscogniauxia mediterranea]
MGDVPPPSVPASEYATQETSSSAYRGMPSTDGQPLLPQGPSPPNNPGFQNPYQYYGPSPNAFTNQFDMTQAQNAGRQGPYNMAAMANSLPQPGYRTGYGPSQQQPRYNTGSVHNMMPQISHYAGQSGMSQLAGQQYYMAQHSQMTPYYNPPMSPTSQQQHQPQQPGSLSPRHNMNMGYYPNTVMMNQQQPMLPGYYYSTSNNYSAATSTMHSQVSHVPYIMQDGAPGGPQESSPPQGNGQDSPGNHPNAVRGPPRKPRQSGHAIWIGNLPPQTDLMNLVHHVCKEAAGLESLFLISKSNCAFANFKDEQSCIAAQQKLHDSKFQTVRLVSRLRKSTVEGATGQTAPTGPAAASPSGQTGPPDPIRSPQAPATETPAPTSDVQNEIRNKPMTEPPTQKDKFFILKSLTVEDLELSVRNGVWATQSHNEETLNNAFKSADNVYLVFSANKSGEYFGFARMVSPINDDPAAAIEFAPKAQATTNLDLPKAIPTEATESCPRGRIIDDSARGTIFWEVERDDADTVPETESEDSASASGVQEEDNTKAWGKPFKLEWVSTTRLPFFRTRGLRNPWNSNREVKIARDGTELEPSAGKRLIGLFNRVQSPAPLAMGMRQSMAMTAGYPPPYRQ